METSFLAVSNLYLSHSSPAPHQTEMTVKGFTVVAWSQRTSSNDGRHLRLGSKTWNVRLDQSSCCTVQPEPYPSVTVLPRRVFDGERSKFGRLLVNLVHVMLTMTQAKPAGNAPL